MRIGWVGLGKLGLSCALAIESKGHEVYGYDISPQVKKVLETRQLPDMEEGARALLDRTNLKWSSVEEMVEKCDLIFLSPQTPHHKKFEGTERLPNARQDFDYSFLVQAVQNVSEAARMAQKHITLVVVSTCLPGTYEKHLKPLLNEWVYYVYNPFFVAMGTTVQDFLNPEFVLMGAYQDLKRYPIMEMKKFYESIHSKPLFWTDITTAEGIKVFYNTAITSKINLANAWMQVAHKMGMNVDDITGALSLATDRIISSKYMRGGGPDSGGCHPRDIIALSWLGQQIDLKPNVFEQMARVREEQTEWTADLVAKKQAETKLPVVVLGKAYKPGTNLTVGSGATLLINLLREKGIEAEQLDPIVDGHMYPMGKALYVVATNHKVFAEWKYPTGSVIIDLWRYVPHSDNYEVIHVGTHNRRSTQRGASPEVSRAPRSD